MSDPAAVEFPTATHWGAYRARVRRGRVETLLPFPGDPDPSPIGAGMAQALTDPLRIPQPMIREGWLKRYVSVPGTCGPTVVVGDDYALKTETVRGPWRIRIIGRKSPKRKAGLPGLPLLSLAAGTQPHPA